MQRQEAQSLLETFIRDELDRFLFQPMTEKIKDEIKLAALKAYEKFYNTLTLVEREELGILPPQIVNPDNLISIG